MKRKKYYGDGLPGIETHDLGGMLIVVEGGDSSGCSTQTLMLRDALERLGYPTAEIGLGKSEFVGPDLQEALKSNILCPITSSLFHATELADQIEKKLIPSLRAGFFVIADRYIYSLYVKDLLRGGDSRWIRSVYGFAIVPDCIFYLDVPPKVQAQWSFVKRGTLDYWQAGRDVVHAPDLYQGFIQYQTKAARAFKAVAHEYKFEVIDGDRDPQIVHDSIRQRLQKILPIRNARADRRVRDRGVKKGEGRGSKKTAGSGSTRSRSTKEKRVQRKKIQGKKQ